MKHWWDEKWTQRRCQWDTEKQPEVVDDELKEAVYLGLNLVVL